MSKDPAFLFYSSDFLTGTMFMSNEQVGKYIRLICAQHQKKRLTEKDMLFICGSYDEVIFSKFKKDDDGFYNERCEIEILKRKKYSESRSNNRKKSTKSTTSKKSNINNISKSYVKHMENENENENVIENKIKIKKEKKHLFVDSEFFELENFIAEMEKDEKYHPFDFNYYHESLKNWSADGNAKINWITTAKNWMLRDLKDKKPKLKPKYEQQREQQQNKPKVHQQHDAVGRELAELFRNHSGGKI